MDPRIANAFSNELEKIAGTLHNIQEGGHRFMELLKGGRHVGVAGSNGLMKGMIRPGNHSGAYSGKLRAAIPDFKPHEMQDEALRSLVARGAVGVPVGAGLIGAGKKIKQELSMPPVEEDFPNNYKYANLSNAIGTMPANPTGLSEVKSTIPNKPLSGKTPKYSKVHSAPTPNPAASHQPVAAAPAVRA